MRMRDLRKDFQSLRRSRRGHPEEFLKLAGEFAVKSLKLLRKNCERHSIEFRGAGAKSYEIFVSSGTKRPFSRPLNTALFQPDPQEFEKLWERFTEALVRGREAGTHLIEGILGDEVDRIFYTAVIGYAAAVDLYKTGDKSTPGTFFEMIVGAAISLLTGYKEEGHIGLPVPTGGEEKVTTDLSFHPEDAPVSLAIATKITTRERVQQAFVHQQILETARPGKYRSILCICSENNVAAPSGVDADERTYDICWVNDTLVPGTIALYQNYLSPLEGFYYVDPPEPYLAGSYEGLPSVCRFSSLLMKDLPRLIQAPH